MVLCPAIAHAAQQAKEADGECHNTFLSYHLRCRSEQRRSLHAPADGHTPPECCEIHTLQTLARVWGVESLLPNCIVKYCDMHTCGIDPRSGRRCDQTSVFIAESGVDVRDAASDACARR